MTEQEAIKVIENEKQCVLRQDGKGCDRKCATCDLVLPDMKVINALDMAIKALEQTQERSDKE